MTDYVVAQSFLSFFVKGAPRERPDLVSGQFRHAPFARTFPSANETTTTKRPQTSRVRDLNQTFCIQKFRDMHICSLIPNIFPNI